VQNKFTWRIKFKTKTVYWPHSRSYRTRNSKIYNRWISKIKSSRSASKVGLHLHFVSIKVARTTSPFAVKQLNALAGVSISNAQRAKLGMLYQWSNKKWRMFPNSKDKFKRFLTKLLTSWAYSEIKFSKNFLKIFNTNIFIFYKKTFWISINRKGQISHFKKEQKKVKPSQSLLDKS
jgi:hypothetical protein